MQASRPFKRVFFAAAVVVVASMVVINWAGVLASRAEQAIKADLQDLDALSKFRVTLLNAETGQRGYLLTGEETYLLPYKVAASQIPADLERLTVLAKEGKLPSEQMARLTELTPEKTNELAQTIALRQKSGLEAALPVVKSGHGKEIMEEIREALDEMTTAVEERFGNSVTYATVMIRARTITAAVVAFLDIVFLWWAYQRLAGEMVRSENATAEALRRKGELEEMVSELKHISYAITHDMRAPLRAMSTFAQFLMEDVKNASEQAKDYCWRIIAAAGRMDKLIQDALYYTKAVSQEVPMEPVDLSRLIRELIETYPNLQKEKADVVIDGGLPTVLGNEALLTQCFSNLLGNAVKFVAPGVRPNVRIRCEERDGMDRIWVEDNGIGIPAAAQQRLFKMFERLTHNHEGSGIGLAVVRKLVQRMGGKVGVESETGKGSRFWVELRAVDPGGVSPTH